MLENKPANRFIYTYNIVVTQPLTQPIRSITKSAESLDRLSRITTRTEMGVWNGYLKKWVEDSDRDFAGVSKVTELIYQNIILAALHPDYEYSICAILPNATTEDDELLNDYFNFSLDLAGGARKHGHFLFTRFGSSVGTVGQFYFPPEKASMGRINYGSISLSANKSLFQLTNAKILVVDDPQLTNNRPDENYENPWEIGDAHGKINSDLLAKLLEGVVEEEVRTTTPTQFRLGIRGDSTTKGIWGKGTIISVPPDKMQGYDLVLPESCFKTHKPPKGANTFDVVTIAALGEAQERKAMGGTQVWSWFPMDVLEDDVMKPTRAECEKLAAMVKTGNIYQLASLFNRISQPKAAEELDVLPEAVNRWFDELAAKWAEGDPEEESDDEAEPYMPTLALILENDLSKVLEKHPYVIDSVRRSLKRKWTKLAINGAVRFNSYMAMPDDSLYDLDFTCRHLKAGPYITLRYPIRHWGDIQLWECVKKPKNDEFRGVFFVSHVTFGGTGELNEEPYGQGGDFDGDYGNAISVNKLPNITQRIKDWSDPNSEHYRRRPKVVKAPKSPIQDTLKKVALRSMDNFTGAIASQIMHAQAKGLTEVVIPDGSGRTVIEVLSQALQDEVDRFKNDLQRDDEAMEHVSQILSKGPPRPKWLGDYKSREAYLTRVMEVGSEEEDNDTISQMIRSANSYWLQANLPAPEKLGSPKFRNLFGPNPITNNLVTQQQLDFARRGQAEYNRRLKNAVQNLDKDNKGISKLMDDLKTQRGVLEDGLKARYPNPQKPDELSTEASAKLWSWATAYWWVAHNEKVEDMPGHPMGKAGLPFLLFPDIIAKQLRQMRYEFNIYGLTYQEEPNILPLLFIKDYVPVVLLGTRTTMDRTKYVLHPDEKGRVVYVSAPHTEAGYLALMPRGKTPKGYMYSDNDMKFCVYKKEGEDDTYYVDVNDKIVLPRELDKDEFFYITKLNNIIVSYERPHPRMKQEKLINEDTTLIKMRHEGEWINVGIIDLSNMTCIEPGQIVKAFLKSYQKKSGQYSNTTATCKIEDNKEKAYVVIPYDVDPEYENTLWDDVVELTSVNYTVPSKPDVPRLQCLVRSSRTDNKWVAIGVLALGCTVIPEGVNIRATLRKVQGYKELIFLPK